MEEQEETREEGNGVTIIIHKGNLNKIVENPIIRFFVYHYVLN